MPLAKAELIMLHVCKAGFERGASDIEKEKFRFILDVEGLSD